LREGQFRATWGREAAAQDARKHAEDAGLTREDRNALENFAEDMRAGRVQ
jgi:hypothetical protein